nr:polyprotein [Beet ringspot virus]
MGFKELFASSLGDAARAKASLVRGMSGWLTATLATVQAAGPEIRATAYSALWAEVDSTKELVPLSAAMLLDQLRADLKCAQVRAQKCTPASTSRFCSCGGILLPGEIKWEDELVPILDCPVGRNFCRDGVHCKRHHGPGETLERVQVFVEAPKCPHCQGTGIIPRSEPMAYIRSEYERQTKTFARPSNPLHEWILEEGRESNHARRCSNWYHMSMSQIDRRDNDPCDASTWMAAAQILFDNADAQVYYPGSNYRKLVGGSKGYDNWCQLPPSKEMCNRLFDWWHRQNTPDYYVPEDTLADFVKPRMGSCHLPIEHDVHLLPREWHGKIPAGNPSHFMACLDGLSSSMEEFLDVFYDCAAQFNGEIEIFLDTNEKPSRVIGNLGGVRVLLTTPAVCSPAKLLPEIGESDFDLLEDETVSSDTHIPPLFKNNGLSALYANLILKQAVVQPTLMAHPDQDEIEDQVDHLENKQGGEIVTTPAFIKMLKEKRKEVRGKEFAEGSEGRLVRASDLTLSREDVFLSGGLFEKFRKSGIVQTFKGKDPKLTKVCVDLTNSQEIIKYPSKEMCSDSSGVHTGQVFTVLNRPLYNELNKLAESGWKEAKSVCLNLHIRSYVPVHTPLYAFCVIMWGHSSDAETASLCGAGVYLGDQEAAVLELPLVCSYLGNSLEDFDAYKRSLVLSTVFFGKSGLSAGQNVFGITAVEFTEYMPTSYGGITHERDSWQAMLRNHQGKDKGRFIAGFNVVDALERDKEEPIKMPHLDLEPVPRTQPVVRTFTGEGRQPLLNKSRSMCVQSFASFRGNNIPIGRRIDNTVEAINYELGRASTSDVSSRLDESRCNLKAGGNYAFGETIELPATVTPGTVLAVFNIFDKIQETNTKVCSEWLEQGYVSHNLTAISHLAPNAFSGVAIWYIFDAYGKIPGDVTTTFELEMARSFDPHVQILRDVSTSTWVIDFHKICGQTLNFSGQGYCVPKIWVIAASTFQLARSTATKFRLEFYTCGEKLVRGLAEQPLSYPIEARHLTDLNLMLAPKQIAVGTYAMITFPVSLAAKLQSTSGRTAYSYAAGLLSHFLGVGGIIHFVVRTTSSAFVTSKLRIALWGTVPTTDQLAQMPHVDVEVNVEASLQIQSPFFSTANFGSSGSAFYVSTLCAPMAPETVETGSEYYIQIKGIEANPVLCREINYKQRFAWCLLECIDNSKASPIKVKIPSRIGNLSSKHVKVTNFVNALAILCATTGMHHGNCIIHFSWSWHPSELGKQVGRLKFIQGMGINNEHIGDVMCYNSLSNTHSVPFQFGSFAGPVTSGGNVDEAENWIEIQSSDFSWVTSLHISIEVLEGFKFYGRSAGPLTIPATVVNASTAPVP